MTKTNHQKTQELQQIRTKYRGLFLVLKNKRNRIIKKFTEALNERRLRDIRNLLK